jgi:hypothetical protein
MKCIRILISITILGMVNDRRNSSRLPGQRILTGTVAFLIATDDTILIASDTKQVEFRNNVITKSDTVCKIEKKGNMVYVIAGIFVSINPDTGLDIDLDKTINALNLDGQTFELKIKEIKNAIKQPIREIAQSMKKYQVDLFNVMSTSGQFVSLLLGSFENGKPVSAFINFKIQSDQNGGFEIVDTFSCKAETPRFLNIGKSEAFNFAVNSNGVFSKQFKSYVELLNGLVQLQSTLTPNDVGMPADIIEITKDKITWVQKNQKCDE